MNAPLVAAVNAWHRLAATPVAYLLLWTGLVAVGVACIVLYRTRWGQAKPLRKCAVLSLLVHVMLAGLAMTVKIVVGDGGGAGGGAPIRIRIIDGEGAATSVVAMISPPLLERPEPNSESTVLPINETVLLPETDAETANETPVVAQPDAIETPKEGVTPTIETPPATEAVADVKPIIVEPTADETPPAITPKSVAENDSGAAREATETRTPDQPTVASVSTTRPASSSGGSSPSAGPGDPYAGRTAAGRLGLVEGQGGSRETEAAVVAALNWLAAAQSTDGRWDAARHGAGVERKILGEDRHGAGRDADTGITALGLLAFLGAGHSHVAGDYQPTVERGLAYLLRSQAADGNLFGGAGLYSQMYCHSIATFALAEAQAMTGDRRLANGVSKAIAYSIRAQDPVTGGWRYRPLDRGDTSQLGWQVMALASGERAGAAMPLQTWSGVDRFLRSVRRGQFGGLASYRDDQPQPSTSMTAEALYCRVMLTAQAGGVVDERAAAEATRQILASPPTASQVNLYYWYYATLALHHRQRASDEAAAAWRAWNEALTSVLVSRQEASGPQAGSWTPDAMWGGHGGRVFSTALSAMCLEVYYRYEPLPPPNRQEIVTRPGFREPVR
jgi:hypothetical protein